MTDDQCAGGIDSQRNPIDLEISYTDAKAVTNTPVSTRASSSKKTPTTESCKPITITISSRSWAAVTVISAVESLHCSVFGPPISWSLRTDTEQSEGSR